MFDVGKGEREEVECEEGRERHEEGGDEDRFGEVHGGEEDGREEGATATQLDALVQ